jgi:integrase
MAPNLLDAPPDRRRKREDLVLARLGHFCSGQGLGSPPLLGALLEAFVAQGLEGRAPSTKGTYRSVLRQVGALTRGETQSIPYPGAPAARPYAPKERAELLAIALAQPKPWRRQSALALLALGIGAGLRPGEIVAARRADVIIGRAGVRVSVKATTSRLVPVRPPFAGLLKELIKGQRGDALFHPEDAVRSYPNFVNDFCRQLVRDPGDAPLSANRCRASFICDHLSDGTELSVLIKVAGINEVESLLRYARHVDGAPATKAALRAKLASERA